MNLQISNEIVLILSTIIIGCFAGYPMSQTKTTAPWLERCVTNCLRRADNYLVRVGHEYKANMPTGRELRDWCERTACLIESEENESNTQVNAIPSMSSTTSNCEMKCLQVGNNFLELRRIRKISLCRRLCQE